MVWQRSLEASFGFYCRSVVLRGGKPIKTLESNLSFLDRDCISFVTAELLLR